MQFLTSASVRLVVSALALAGAAEAAVTPVQKGKKLVVKGSAGGDNIGVEGALALGEIVVRDNGFFVQSFVGVRDVVIETGDGDDTVRVSGLQIGGTLTAKLGEGADRFELDNELEIGLDLAVIIGRDLDISMGADVGDLVEFDVQSQLAVRIAHDLTLSGAADVSLDGTGPSSGSSGDDICVGNRLRIEMATASDVNADGETMFLDDVNVGGITRLVAGGADEVVEISNCHFARSVEIRLGGGNDVLRFADVDSEFNSTVTIDGGAGEDSVAEVTDLLLAQFPKFKNLEEIEALP